MNFVDIFFTLLNFGILVGGLLYTFKKWVLPKVQEELVNEQAEQELIASRRENLEKRYLALDSEQDAREQWYRDLSYKVVVWKDAVLREKKFAQEEVLRGAQLVQLRSEKQIMLRTMQRVQARVVPHAVAKARLELYDYYQSSSAGETFVDDVIVEMREYHGCTK